MTTREPISCALEVQFHYEIAFTEDVFSPANLLLATTLTRAGGASAEKALVVFESAILQERPHLPDEIAAYFAAHPTMPALVCAPVPLGGGEALKANCGAVDRLHVLIERYGLSRHSYVLAVGGGALLDVAGFAASTAHRGIRHVRLPTTTLSQADGGVGVKNGINAFGKKNFIGTFAPPFAVINDFAFIRLLPEEQQRGGYVEAIKVALIRDVAFFAQIEKDADALLRFDPPVMQKLIRRCAELHIQQIADGGDPFEFGSARPLDFGHWSAHKIEQLSGFQIGHAQSVAIGIALDVAYSRRSGLLEAAAAERILLLLEKLRFRLFAPELIEKTVDGELAVVAGLDEFREHLGGELSITQLREIGVGVEVHEMSPELLLAAVNELREREARS